MSIGPVGPSGGAAPRAWRIPPDPAGNRWGGALTGGRYARLERTGSDGAPVAVEVRAVVGLADVVKLARELGVGLLVESA